VCSQEYTSMSKDLYFVFGLEPEICLNLLNDDHYLGCQKYILKKFGAHQNIWRPCLMGIVHQVHTSPPFWTLSQPKPDMDLLYQKSLHMKVPL